MCLLTSVPEACFRHFGRKFRALYPCGLPYQGPVFGILDGSFMIHALADFRIQGLFSAFCTEVSCPVPLLTSVPMPRFRRFVRKFHALCPCRLPYQDLVFGVLYGSFMPCALADFRTQGLFSVFWTEVFCPARIQASVLRSRFLHFGWNFWAC